LDLENPIGAFLRARRALVRPESVGLPDLGRRRVRGLRREELAMLAGVSVDYYVRLEQGRDRKPSEQVLHALACASQPDQAAAVHLHELARPTPRRSSPRRALTVGPGLRQLLDSWWHAPAFVVSAAGDVLAANALADALAPGGLGEGSNILRTVFLDPTARDFYADWHDCAQEAVAALRAAAGANLDDPRLNEIVGELSIKSPEFRNLWSRHDVRPKTTGRKYFNHPLVGPLTLAYDTFSVCAAPSQTLIVHHAAPDTPAAQKLALLAALVADGPSPTPADYADPAGPTMG
jgi:transcriptional regulator with XRE-family HTH domain